MPDTNNNISEPNNNIPEPQPSSDNVGDSFSINTEGTEMNEETMPPPSNMIGAQMEEVLKSKEPIEEIKVIETAPEEEEQIGPAGEEVMPQTEEEGAPTLTLEEPDALASDTNESESEESPQSTEEQATPQVEPIQQIPFKDEPLPTLEESLASQMPKAEIEEQTPTDKAKEEPPVNEKSDETTQAHESAQGQESLEDGKEGVVPTVGEGISEEINPTTESSIENETPSESPSETSLPPQKKLPIVFIGVPVLIVLIGVLGAALYFGGFFSSPSTTDKDSKFTADRDPIEFASAREVCPVDTYFNIDADPINIVLLPKARAQEPTTVEESEEVIPPFDISKCVDIPKTDCELINNLLADTTGKYYLGVDTIEHLQIWHEECKASPTLLEEENATPEVNTGEEEPNDNGSQKKNEEFNCEKAVESIKTAEPEERIVIRQDAEVNDCVLPIITQCEIFEEGMISTQQGGDAPGFVRYGLNWLEDKDCYPEEVDRCSEILATSTIYYVGNQATGLSLYEEELNTLKSEYYSIPECKIGNKERCEKIGERLGIPIGVTYENLESILEEEQKNDTGTTEQEEEESEFFGGNEMRQLVKGQVDPGTVFEDDIEFYTEYCIGDLEVEETSSEEKLPAEGTILIEKKANIPGEPSKLEIIEPEDVMNETEPLSTPSEVADGGTTPTEVKTVIAPESAPAPAQESPEVIETATPEAQEEEKVIKVLDFVP